MSTCMLGTSVSYTLVLPYDTANSHLIICSVSCLCFITMSIGFSELPHGKQSSVFDGGVGVEVN